MMYQKDYILRMIEMIGELIAALMGHLKKGNVQQAQKMLNEAYPQFLKEDASFFFAIPKEELTSTLLNEHNYTQQHLEILAELFNAEGELRLSQNENGLSLEFFQKSLILQEYIDREGKVFSLDRTEKIRTLRQKLLNIQKDEPKGNH